MMKWFLKEWETQWPLIRFEVYKWGTIGMGGVIIGLSAKLLHAVLKIPDAYLYGVLTVIALALFVFFAHKLPHREVVSSESTPKPAVPPAEPDTLAGRIDKLAKDLFGYLKECGEEIPPTVSYIVKVHSGYMRHWYPKVEDVAYQLGMDGYVDFNFAGLIGNSLDAFSYKRIREIAEYLLKIKNELELHGLRKSTLTQKEVDDMTSGDLRKRCDDPGFQGDVNMLGMFKPR